MKRGQKNNSFFQHDTFAQYGTKNKIFKVDIYASRKIRRIAKRKGLIADRELSEVDYIKNTKKNRRNENDTSTDGRHYARVQRRTRSRTRQEARRN
jgi:hypothetical protein